MKLVCTQENLTLGLSIVARLSDKNINLPILSNVLLRAQKDGLTLIATNLEIGIKTKVRGKIEVEGEFTANARLFADFVSTLKKENVSIELDDKNLNIKGENHQTTIRGMDPAEFPVIPEVGPSFLFSVAATHFREALSQTLFAVSADESRPELNGVFIQVGDGSCVMAATDSYRLSEKTIPVPQAKEKKSVIVPARTLQETLRVLELSDAADVQIAINDNQIQFSFGETQIVSRIITGEYPDYKQIIPTAFKNEVRFATEEMRQAIKTTSLFCKQGINDVRLSLEKRFSDIAVNAENSNLGKNVSNVRTESKNQEMDIVFNYKFLLDGLSHIVGEAACLKTNDPTSPALLVSASGDDLLYVIMPIKQ
ncbi:MAG: DNA polymerase III subunit beta [Candidatus Komeilibacteria bacterium RIFCSPLOWO2_01_FULL_53_11]|uniref:Beta sliding clamp n=1 Tax=Candidatus Komeilibacteria bacterium RIFCSPLOWO2_01_FULL_53_11 TaxID=1798552 RepID=A0A1G2BQZ4_9BACT|nr:MAG: DNA polymerase III subunit beta [Candidatus Komeilibacteria bacterium RIFCSPLOWO2_01_FULL_53_11]